MAISVVLPHALYPYSQGAGTLTVDEPCETVADALAAIAARWPALTDRVLTEQGEVFVGEESIKFIDGLNTTVNDGTTITIVPAVSGG
jgi:molybdopterin synthase sulfur carrier subunit